LPVYKQEAPLSTMKYIYSLLVLLLLKSLSVEGQCNTATNLAFGRAAVASSLESGAFPASQAFDGDMTTRWSSAWSDPQYIYVDLGAVFSLCQVSLFWEAAYASSFNIDISNDASTWTTVYSITGNTSTTNVISITGSARYVRMYGIARATGYGYSLYEFQVYGNVPACGSANLALNGPAVASSLENAGFPASNAFDGDMTTRWSSAFSDPQYIYVDLGSVYSLCQVSLFWDAAYGSTFNIDISNDATTWTTVNSVIGNASTTNDIPISGSGRYVRMYGISRATSFGYSIYEFQVFGQAVLPITLVYFKALNENNDSVSLRWETSMQSNNSYFEVQRSPDGKNFTTISRVDGAGYASGPVNYSVSDRSPLDGFNYYRLKQVDLDRHSTYSGSAAIEINRQGAEGITVYPNPVKDLLYIASRPSDQILKVRLYDAMGAAINTYQNDQGTQMLTISVIDLPHGIYFLQVFTSNSTKTIKVVK
jgi:hypothetical protein